MQCDPALGHLLTPRNLNDHQSGPCDVTPAQRRDFRLLQHNHHHTWLSYIADFVLLGYIGVGAVHILIARYFCWLTQISEMNNTTSNSGRALWPLEALRITQDVRFAALSICRICPPADQRAGAARSCHPIGGADATRQRF